MNWLDVLMGIGKVIREAIGASAEEWADLVEQHPQGAASKLRLAAARLEGRADAFRNPNGWRARRNREVAKRLRSEAATILEMAKAGLPCPVGAKAAPWK